MFHFGEMCGKCPYSKQQMQAYQGKMMYNDQKPSMMQMQEESKETSKPVSAPVVHKIVKNDKGEVEAEIERNDPVQAKPVAPYAFGSRVRIAYLW